MLERLATLAIVTEITFGVPLASAAGESWYEVSRGDHRDWTFSLSGGLALLHLNGRGTVDESLGDTRLSFAGTLDVKDLDTPWGEADLQLLRGQHLRFGYHPMRFEGSQTLDSDIVVGGITYSAGDDVDSKLRLDQYELSFRSEFWLTEFVSIAPLAQVTLVDARVQVKDRTLGAEVTEKALLPLPYLGLRAEVYPLARLGLYAEGKGFTIGSPASIWEVSGGASLYLTRNLSLTGRYRYSDYAIDVSHSAIDLAIGGPYLGATVRF